MVNRQFLSAVVIVLIVIVVAATGVLLALHNPGTAAVIAKASLTNGMKCSYDEQCTGGLCAKVFISGPKECTTLNSFYVGANCTTSMQCQSDYCLYPFDSHFSQKTSPTCALANSVSEEERCIDNPQCHLGLTCRRSSSSVYRTCQELLSRGEICERNSDCLSSLCTDDNRCY